MTEPTPLRHSPDGFACPAWCVQPEGAPRGGMVVLPEIFGVNAHIRAITTRFAARGYAAVAPDTFARVQPGVDLGYGQGDVATGRKLKAAVERLPEALVLGDIQARSTKPPRFRAARWVWWVFAGAACWPGAPPASCRDWRPWPATTAAE